MGNWPLVTYFRGHLIGNSDNLAAPGLEYPTVALQQIIKDVTFSPSEGYNYEIEHNVQALIAEGILLKPESTEIWGLGKS
jgi:hypothetical protein